MKTITKHLYFILSVFVENKRTYIRQVQYVADEICNKTIHVYNKCQIYSLSIATVLTTFCFKMRFSFLMIQ